jgi:hypothetical protein
MRFGLIGDGRISEKHKAAIREIGGRIVRVFDPAREVKGPVCHDLNAEFFDGVDWVVICSPTHCHYNQIKRSVQFGKRVICEKPYVLPWQPIIDSPDVSVVLQLRWMDLPETVDKIRVRAVRHPHYFASWKGDPYLTGGLFFDLAIHYVDLARRLGCELELEVADHGDQFRFIGDIDVSKVNMEELYTRMYEDIVFNGGGVRPSHVAELHWLLGRYTERYGAGKEILNKLIKVTPNGLL